LKLALIIAALLFFAVILAIAKKKASGTATDKPWPFYPKAPLSQPEQVLYHRLVKCLPNHIILAQVQVSRVLGVKKGHNFHEWNNRMSYDFVVCSKDSKVIAVIELDDKTHNAKNRVEADAKKDRATQSAGLKIIRWNVKSMPGPSEIISTFSESQAAIESEVKEQAVPAQKHDQLPPVRIHTPSATPKR
jgi:hypothetical protein